ncbi:MAG: hypothetical protein QNJ72_08390 [Pleurocapsa sp. MO_226.B13]|nr:hypothetical protein [Pleurocapsa sp. MO_226.B13]
MRLSLFRAVLFEKTALYYIHFESGNIFQKAGRIYFQFFSSVSGVGRAHEYFVRLFLDIVTIERVSKDEPEIQPMGLVESVGQAALLILIKRNYCLVDLECINSQYIGEKQSEYALV